MTREGVIVTSLLIDYPNQIKKFQIRIPRELKNIIGVELGFFQIEPSLGAPMSGGGGERGYIMPISVVRNLLIGEVKLQSMEKANVFYSGELVLNQNMPSGDFTSGFFPPQVYSHGTLSHEEEVKVSSKTTILQGIYKDRFYESLEGDFYKYKVNVYVWADRKEKQLNG